MLDRMNWDNLAHLGQKDEAKFVIKDRTDYEWAVEIVRKYDLTSRCSVLFGPVFGALEPRQLAEWILADRLPIRFQLQLHKYVWAPDMRGV
jgi:7-carboxy-7-deazaguanine synthase